MYIHIPDDLDYHQWTDVDPAAPLGKESSALGSIIVHLPSMQVLN